MDKLLLLFWLLVTLITLCSQCEGDAECQLPRPYIGEYISKKRKGNTCYYLFISKSRNWYESRTFCREQGFSMVKVTREMLDNVFIISQFFEHQLNKDVWLGGRAIVFPHWTFVNGAVLNIEDVRDPTVGLFADSYYNQYCGVIKIQDNIMRYGVESCSSSFAFLCRLKHCRWNESCLKLVTEYMTWFEARSNCTSLDGDLFYMNSGENLHSSNLTHGSTLYTKINELGTPVFVGLRHRTWEWTDGTEILHTNWKLYQPSNFNEQCLAYLHNSNGKWNDDDCINAKLTLCEGAISNAKTTSDSVSETSVIERGGLTAPTRAMTTSYPATGGPRKTSMGSNSSDVTAAPLTSPPITIILASLLGVFFVVILALVIFILCRKWRNKSTEDDADFVENNYYDSTVEPIERTPVASPPNPLYTNSEISAETLSSHLHKAQDTNGAAAKSSEKPRIRPKPIFGPKTGDVYSSVERVNRSPLQPF